LKREERTMIYIVPSIFIIIGSLATILILRQRRIAMQSETWPYVEGKVALSKVEESWSSSSGGRSRMYTPKVIYEYVVDGQSYFGEQISIVRVYYDPERPSESALQVGVRPFLYFFLLVGLLFIAFGLFLLVHPARG
jgi:hypothetical protein